MTRRLPLSALLVIIGVVALRAADPPRYRETGVLTLEDRVRAQARIEKVWYEHRIWPKENPAPKPSFGDAMPEAVLRARAAEALRQSAALATVWNDPVTDAELQAELSRMIRDSRDPALLDELFAALDRDPDLIAEILVRPIVAERRLRARFAADRSRHANAYAAALRAYARAGEGDWEFSDGDYRRVVWLLDDGGRLASDDPREIRLDAAEFAAQRAAAPPEGAVSALHESPEGFWFTRTLHRGPGRIESESVFFAKPDFEAWWRAERDARDDGASRAPVRGGRRFTLTPAEPRLPATGGCDSWAPMAAFTDSPQISSPAPRYSHTAVWTGTEMIVWGGNTSANNTGGRYNPATDNWLATSTTGAPAGRAYHTAIWTGSVMVVWGGGGLNSGGRYNPTFDSWAATSTGTNVPSARNNHTAIWTGSVMVVWGGSLTVCPSSCTTTYYGNGGRYDPAGDSWAPVLTPGPAERIFHTAVWTGTYMVIFGGYNLTGGPYTEFNGGGRYDPVGNTWLGMTTTNAPPTVEGHSAVWSGSRMIVWGGNHNSNQQTNGGGRYDPVNDVWYSMSATGAPSARDLHQAVWSTTASAMVVWGGYPSYTAVNTGGRYDPALDQWTATSTTGAPPAARQHSAIWSPERGEMIVWGGQDNSNNALGGGGRYDPVANSWAPVPVFDGINTRANHSAIWTGSEMIVWGGYDVNNNPKNSGGRYVPATDSWSYTSTVNAPARRGSHTAVWTGTHMVIWGNSGGNGTLNTCGRYNPTSNTWLSTSTGANAPVYDRSGAGMIWTGTKVVIWGGYGFDGAQYASLATGQRYDPNADTWATVSTSGAAGPREGHATVWTGSEMLVWGGRSRTSTTDTYVATGGRYDPVNDVWSAMGSSGVPTARGFHSFAWAGGYLSIVHGADASNAYLNGGRYSPGSNAWSAMSTVGMPSYRSRSGTVSTGAQMIIWSADYNANGARYNPVANTWTATNTSGQPSARTDQSGVWTGNGIIYWAGRLTSPPYMTNTGGIYLYGPDSIGTSLRGGKSATVDFTWTAASGATSYNVKRCTAAGGFCNPSGTVATPSGTTYNEALDGNSYYYAVEAVNACGTAP